MRSGYVLGLVLFCFAGTATADLTIEQVRLSGDGGQSFGTPWTSMASGDPLVVEPGSSVTIEITVTTFHGLTPPNWQATAVDFVLDGELPWCRNEPDVTTADTTIHTLTTLVPVSIGSYELVVMAFPERDCLPDVEHQWNLAGAVTVDYPKSLVFDDIFDRSVNVDVGNGWIESETEPGQVAVTAEKSVRLGDHSETLSITHEVDLSSAGNAVVYFKHRSVRTEPSDTLSVLWRPAGGGEGDFVHVLAIPLDDPRQTFELISIAALTGALDQIIDLRFEAMMDDKQDLAFIGDVAVYADPIAVDQDEDGSFTPDDCNDQDNTIYPGAPEIADDGIDQDCNGFDTVTCYVDADGDGLGSQTVQLSDDGTCEAEGLSANNIDCDDTPENTSDEDGDNVCLPTDECPNTIPGIGVDEVGCPPLVVGDFDRDGDVDGDDYQTFSECLTGPMVGPPAEGCEITDLDEDNDVDQSDFGVFQRCISGADIPGTPGCESL